MTARLQLNPDSLAMSRSARPAGRWVLFSLLPLLLLASIGCAGTAMSNQAEGRTGGLALDLLVERPGGSRAFYRVFPDGTIGFAGGADARARRLTWTGTMTDEQIDTLRRLLDEHRWKTQPPADGPDTDAVTFQIDLRSVKGRERFRVSGESADVMPIYNLLRDVTAQRFDHIMETLPRPGTEPEGQ